MSLEERVLDVLAKKDADASEIAEEIEVEIERVKDVLQRLKAAGLLIEMD